MLTLTQQISKMETNYKGIKEYICGTCGDFIHKATGGMCSICRNILKKANSRYDKPKNPYEND